MYCPDQLLRPCIQSGLDSLWLLTWLSVLSGSPVITRHTLDALVGMLPTVGIDDRRVGRHDGDGYLSRGVCQVFDCVGL